MPRWLEQFFVDYPVLAWSPLVVCVGCVGTLWWWQVRRGRAGERRPLRVGWFGAVATMIVLLGAVVLAGRVLGMWGELWEFVCRRPELPAWWLGAAGGFVIVWGVLVHAWRKEARLKRQCRRCGYDMTGVPGLMTCTECGRVARNEKQLRPRNVRRGAVWAGAVLIGLALMTPSALTAVRRGTAAAMVPSRTLVWWAGATSDPPAWVLTELSVRIKAGEGAEALRGRIAEESETLARRMIKSRAPARSGYARLLRDVRTEGTRRVGMEGLASADAEDQKGAALLLIIIGEFDLSAEALVPLMSNPAAGTELSVLCGRSFNTFLARLDGRDGAEAESQTQRIRELLRLLSHVGSAESFNDRDLFERLMKHEDPEIAAGAAVLLHRFANMASYRDDGVLLRAMLRGRQVLIDMGRPFASLPRDNYDLVNNPSEFTIAWINDPDPTVRKGLFAAMDKLTSAYAASAKGPRDVPTLWLLPRLNARLQIEDDPRAKEALQKLISTMERARSGTQ